MDREINTELLVIFCNRLFMYSVFKYSYQNKKERKFYEKFIPILIITFASAIGSVSQSFAIGQFKILRDDITLTNTDSSEKFIRLAGNTAAPSKEGCEKKAKDACVWVKDPATRIDCEKTVFYKCMSGN